MWLINADKLMEYCRNQKIRTVDCNDIARFPTIDAKPVIHGRWKHRGKMMECSSCGLELKSDERYDWMWNFCPHCGADMRETDNGEV